MASPVSILYLGLAALGMCVRGMRLITNNNGNSASL